MEGLALFCWFLFLVVGRKIVQNGRTASFRFRLRLVAFRWGSPSFETTKEPKVGSDTVSTSALFLLDSSTSFKATLGVRGVSFNEGWVYNTWLAIDFDNMSCWWGGASFFFGWRVCLFTCSPASRYLLRKHWISCAPTNYMSLRSTAQLIFLSALLPISRLRVYYSHLHPASSIWSGVSQKNATLENAVSFEWNVTILFSSFFGTRLSLFCLFGANIRAGWPSVFCWSTSSFTF